MKVVLEREKLDHHMRFFQPSRPVLVTSLNVDESINVAPFSWVTPISSTPPMIALALLARPKPQVTLENIRRNGEFVVNLPSLALKEKLILSSYQYKTGVNKFEALGFKPQKSKYTKTPGIAQCDANIESFSEKIIATGDHDLIIARVESITYEKEKFDGRFLRNLDKGLPLMHFNHYRYDNGQIHVFAEGIRGYDICFVEYPERDKKR